MKKVQINSVIYLSLTMAVLLGVRLHVSEFMQARVQKELQSLLRHESSVEEVCVGRLLPKSEKFDNGSKKKRSLEKTTFKKRVGQKNKTTKTSNAIKKSLIEINQATKEELIALPGLAEVLSTRIIKFRDRLGGFYSLDQLADVYGLPPETVVNLRSFLTCDGKVEKINLSSDDFKTLLRHPYLNYDQVKGVKNFTRRNGSIDSIDKLIESTGKNRENAKKVWHYVLVKASSTS